MDIKRRELLFGAAASMALPGAAAACNASWQQCDPVPDNQFRNGTINRSPDCTITFRLRPELLTRKGIVLRDGSYQWTFRLITLDRNGRPKWQQAHRIVNSPARRQSVYSGTWVATYITCDLFTGWYGHYVNGCVREATLQPLKWRFDWKQLERMTG